MHLKRPGLRRIAIILAVVVLAPIVVPFVFPWTGINCKHADINIKTGQARYSRSLWFVRITSRIEDTPLSLALKGETVDVADIREWQRVVTLSPGVRHSPHYRFHGALHQAYDMGRLASKLEMGPERRRKIARTILTAWQESEHRWGAGEILDELIDEAYTNAKHNDGRRNYND